MGTLMIGQYDSLSGGLADSTIDMFEGRSVSATSDITVDNAVAYVTPDFSGFTAGVAMVSDGTNNAQRVDAMEYVVRYTNGGLTAGVGYLDNTVAGGVDTDVTFAAAAYDFGDFSINGGYENTAAKLDVYTIGGSYTLGNNILRAAYQDTENTSSAYVVEGVHNFSKRTAMYANYEIVDADAANSDTDTLGIGLRHNF